jgi:hypothetical protein
VEQQQAFVRGPEVSAQKGKPEPEALGLGFEPQFHALTANIAIRPASGNAISHCRLVVRAYSEGYRDGIAYTG